MALRLALRAAQRPDGTEYAGTGSADGKRMCCIPRRTTSSCKMTVTTRDCRYLKNVLTALGGPSRGRRSALDDHRIDWGVEGLAAARAGLRRFRRAFRKLGTRPRHIPVRTFGARHAAGDRGDFPDHAREGLGHQGDGILPGGCAVSTPSWTARDPAGVQLLCSATGRTDGYVAYVEAAADGTVGCSWNRCGLWLACGGGRVVCCDDNDGRHRAIIAEVLEMMPTARPTRRQAEEQARCDDEARARRGGRSAEDWRPNCNALREQEQIRRTPQPK